MPRLLRTLAPLLLLAAASVCCYGQEVKLPAEIKVARDGVWFVVAPDVVDGGQPRWRVDPGLTEQRLDALFQLPPEYVPRGRVYSADNPGRYKVEVWNAKGDIASEIAVCWVVVGDPKPDTTPVPIPKPDPTPDPAPLPLAGMRVLTIFESDTPLPKTIYDAIQSPVVDEYLRLKCLMGQDGKTPERRKLDDDDKLANLSQAWRDLRAKMPADLPLGADGYPVPYVAIGDSSGVVVHSGPYPANEAAALELFKRFGGN